MILTSTILDTNRLTTLPKKLPLFLQNTRDILDSTLMESCPFKRAPSFAKVQIPFDIRLDRVEALLCGGERGPVSVEGAAALFGWDFDAYVDLVERPGEGAGAGIACLSRKLVMLFRRLRAVW